MRAPRSLRLPRPLRSPSRPRRTRRAAGAALLLAALAGSPLAAGGPPAPLAFSVLASLAVAAGEPAPASTDSAAGPAAPPAASAVIGASGASGASGDSAAGSGAAASPAASPAVAAPTVDALPHDARAAGKPLETERATDSVFPFGRGRPVLRCAPLRACALELEAGEAVLATSLGDTERWLVQSAFSGPGARTPLLVVKPTACDLSTNLLVSTDRRIYEIALESPPCRGARAADGADGAAGAYNPRLPYTGLARFTYPDDLVRRWRDQEELARQKLQRDAEGRTPLAPAARLARLNFDYAWDRGRRLPWNPREVFDDGEHTYLVLPPASHLAELPLLFALDAGGALALLNYRLDGDTLVADRVLERAVLLVGAAGGRGGRSGRGGVRLELTNRAFGRKAGS
ncbi:MAG TPA: TrbG/VirB9 family P-type conjugative transfer protein [Thermoanaerobaculia bacterium]|nr:TrbG/VirB9 family P-type conjugative transfer protein [Thermoanaerobaculia bacterium]